MNERLYLHMLPQGLGGTLPGFQALLIDKQGFVRELLLATPLLRMPVVSKPFYKPTFISWRVCDTPQVQGPSWTCFSCMLTGLDNDAHLWVLTVTVGRTVSIQESKA